MTILCRKGTSGYLSRYETLNFGVIGLSPTLGATLLYNASITSGVNKKQTNNIKNTFINDLHQVVIEYATTTTDHISVFVIIFFIY